MQRDTSPVPTISITDTCHVVGGRVFWDAALHPLYIRYHSIWPIIRLSLASLKIGLSSKITYTGKRWLTHLPLRKLEVPDYFAIGAKQSRAVCTMLGDDGFVFNFSDRPLTEEDLYDPAEAMNIDARYDRASALVLELYDLQRQLPDLVATVRGELNMFLDLRVADACE